MADQPPQEPPPPEQPPAPPQPQQPPAPLPQQPPQPQPPPPYQPPYQPPPQQPPPPPPPGGYGSGPPQGGYGPTPPGGTGSGGSGVSWRAIALVLATVIAVLGAVVVGLVVSGDDEAEAAEVMVEPISSNPRNPFMPPVGTDQPDVTPPPESGGQFSGDTAGLYGGTMNVATCDPQKMVIFLQQNPDKASAWAGVLGIQPADIPTYVNELTPVVLRADTYVNNHGFDDGQATIIPAVLQAGTAVLVDKYGSPVVKCYCGNPLTYPRVYPEPVYIGPRWPGFTPGSITIIQSTTVIIDIFILVDPVTGVPFERPAGSTGNEDRPETATTTTTTAPSAATTRPTTATPRTQPPATQGGPTPEQRAIAKVEQASQQCYPFPAPIEDQASGDVSTRAGGPSSFVVEVVSNTVTGKTQIFTWNVDRNTLRFTPANQLATIASNHCPLLR